MHIYICITYWFIEVNILSANHARQTASNRSPLAGLEPTTFRLQGEYTYMYKCIYRYILWVQLHHYIQFFGNIHIKLDRHARQTPKSIV